MLQVAPQVLTFAKGPRRIAVLGNEVSQMVWSNTSVKTNNTNKTHWRALGGTTRETVVPCCVKTKLRRPALKRGIEIKIEP